jgi:hypothetical protein
MESPDKKIESVKADKKEKRRNDSRYENEGLVRVEIDLDFKTYVCLLKLVEESGYEIDTYMNKRQAPNTKSGITGVITQGIAELYLKYIERENRDLDMHLDKIQQQAYIAKNRIYAIKKSKLSFDKKIDKMRKTTPTYIDIDENLKVKIKERDEKSHKSFPVISRPTISEPMKKDLEKKKLDRFISL